jgi:hypothetical protein
MCEVRLVDPRTPDARRCVGAYFVDLDGEAVGCGAVKHAPST